MLPLDYPFRVRTGSSRRPTPKEFAHLRKWAAPDEKFLRLTSNEEITNLAQQFDETDVFNVSNIFQRALSFIFGQTDLGPRIIEATLDGALHVAIDGLLSDTKNLKYAPFRSNSTDPIEIVGATPGQKIHVVNLMFTVDGPVSVLLLSGIDPISGLMDFGDTGEPKGVVIPLGFGPIVCLTGEAFNIELDAAQYISGFCTYYKQIA
ncbi:hypothetical protein ES703_108734 [subsurface metagenome]